MASFTEDVKLAEKATGGCKNIFDNCTKFFKTSTK